MSSHQPTKIWIRGTNWVGDAILTIPTLKAVRECFPSAEITLAVRPWVGELFESLSEIDHVQIYDRVSTHRGWRGRSKFIAEVKSHRFDLAILLPNSFEAAYLAWRAGIRERIGFATDGRGFLLTKAAAIHRTIFKQHQCFYYLEMLRQTGFISQLPPIKCIDLPVSNTRMELARQLLKGRGVKPEGPIIGLNPGAFFGSAKRWLPDRYAAVADGVIDALGGDVLIFGAANERLTAQTIGRAMRHVPKIFSGETTLAELAALLKCCSLVITNDSGPMHMATAVGTRTLAIFGSTDEIVTAPLGPNARVLTKRVSCSPCLLRECPLDHRCMTRISVEEVLAAALEMLSH